MTSEQLVHDLLETGVGECAVLNTEANIQLSIAISLKRIADVLDGTSVGLRVTETIFGRNRIP